MHVLQVIDSLSWGGAEKLQLTFAREAYAHGLQLSVICLEDDPEAQYPPMIRKLGANVQIMPGNRLLSFERIIRIIRYLRKETVDIVHTHLAYANIIGALTGAFAGVPVVSTLHSIGTDPRHYHPIRYRLEKWLLSSVVKKNIAAADAVAGVYKKILPPQTISVIPNAIEPVEELTSKERDFVRSELMGNANATLYISVGRLSPAKGYPDLLSAFAILKNECPDVYLIIAGDGSLFEELSNQIDAYELENHVQLLGARSDVPRLLGASDIYVSSSHREGLPLSILEAMSAGLPVVVTEVGGVVNLVQGRGILVHPQEPKELAKELLRLKIDLRLRKSLGTLAREHVNRHYSPVHWYERILAIYQEVLSCPVVLSGIV